MSFETDIEYYEVELENRNNLITELKKENKELQECFDECYEELRLTRDAVEFAPRSCEDGSVSLIHFLQDRVKELEGMLASVTRETDTRIAELEKFGNECAIILTEMRSDQR